MRVLISGGAGFIGTSLARRLQAQGDDVTILDNLIPQIHQHVSDHATRLLFAGRFIERTVCDISAWIHALKGQDAVVHLAAETGTGQSMYELAHYERTNVGGTAKLCEALIKNVRLRITRVVLASSRAVYGEGAYHCTKDGLVYPTPQQTEKKNQNEYDPVCPVCKGECAAVPTKETAPLQPTSFYGLTKMMQEQVLAHLQKNLGVKVMILRLQNIYGPGQSLINPYTGIIPLIAKWARHGEEIKLFEDGQASRDFTYIDDVVDALVTSLSFDAQETTTVNIGSGTSTSIAEAAIRINEWYGEKSFLKHTGMFRDGDIRHALADIDKAQRLLSYTPKWTFDNGIKETLTWFDSLSVTPNDKYSKSLQELAHVKLIHQANDRD